MADLPVMLRVEGRRCVVVGGGPVAARRAEALSAAGADVCVVAPRLDPKIVELGVTVRRGAYEPSDLDGAFLVVIATDDAAVNGRVGQDAAARGVLVNRADEPDAGDLTVPAHRRFGPLTVAVHSGGVSASAARRVLDELAEHLDPSWAALLGTVAPFRPRVQQRVGDPARRAALLRRLTDEAARHALRSGGVEALRAHCQRLLDAADASSPSVHHVAGGTPAAPADPEA